MPRLASARSASLRLGFAVGAVGHAGQRPDATGSGPMAAAAGSEPSPVRYRRPGLRLSAGSFLPDPEELARHFPQLEIQELLGHGGMGAVYKARQRRLDRLVALKILPPEVAGAPGVRRAIHPRGPGACAAEPPPHRHRARLRRGRRAVLLPHGVRRRREPAADDRRRQARAARGAGHRPSGLRGARSMPTTRGSCIATSSRRISCSTRRAG